MSTAPTVGTASEYSASTGSRPIVSLEVGVGSSTTSLYIAVGSSVGGCVVIAAVAIPLIAMIVVLHKRRCHFRGTKYTIGKNNFVHKMGVYHPLFCRGHFGKIEYD